MTSHSVVVLIYLIATQHKAFTKRLSRAVNLDTGTAEILSGDFAHDAILTKAEQLAKQEVQCHVCVRRTLYNL